MYCRKLQKTYKGKKILKKTERMRLGTAIAVLFFVESFATTEGLGYFRQYI